MYLPLKEVLKAMAGLGEVVMFAVKKAVENQLPEKMAGVVKNHIGTLVGGSAGILADEALNKAGIQKEIDGTVYFHLPFLKGIEEKIKELAALHPERKKLFIHVRETLNDGTSLYDETGKEIYNIRSGNRNVKHLLLYEGTSLVGEAKKKLIQNPISFSDAFTITVLGKQLGDLKLSEKKLLWTQVKPSYASWLLRETKKGGVTYHMVEQVLDESGEEVINEKETGAIYLAGSKNYVLDYDESYDSFHRIEMILAFLIIEMQRGQDHLSYQRQRMYR